MSDRILKRVGVIGAGSWGGALAQLCATQGLETVLWARRPELAEEMRATRSSPYLPGLELHPRLNFTSEFSDLAEAEALLYVGPAQAQREVLRAAHPHLAPEAALVLCSKGLERGSLKLMSEVAAEAAPGRPLAILSGPSFAADVARGLPTAVTLAAQAPHWGERLGRALAAPAFRPYLSADVVGAQMGGALKNVLAIACGISEGRNLGESARAALIARGFAEISRLAQSMGGRPETLAGLSGLGDITLTCVSRRSRNYALGVALGEGRSLAELRAGASSVAEGAETAEAAAALARREAVETPIAAAVADLLAGRTALGDAINGLLDRPLKHGET